MVKAWNSAKIQADIKTKVDAVAKAHGEPVSMLKCDWISLMTRFGDQHGDNIHESRLPAQSYFENFEEALSDGSLEAERLDQVVNVLEERAELAKTPHAAKHLGIHLDSSLSIPTRRRFKSVLPATTEALRMKFSVMSNLWLSQRCDNLLVRSSLTSPRRPFRRSWMSCCRRRIFSWTETSLAKG